MSNMTPVIALEKGAEILGVKLYPLGFTFSIVEQGKGSGGHFAVGAFTNGDREIRLWYRFELGGVAYRKADVERGHVEFMQFLGLEDKSAFPGFGSGDPLAGFRRLLQDMEHCGLFLEQNGEGFRSSMKNYVYRRKPTGFAALSKHAKRIRDES
ncbi:MAG: hypothetical protein A2521_12710 [Deltaproteobacteria bacterium RIFOXYD12_FULL_57_12]|nr:MAG: hypothetical protein A2521_12710 [Deltaproteobacteria bacterium RIFOXYD12_FULL_57_12]